MRLVHPFEGLMHNLELTDDEVIVLFRMYVLGVNSDKPKAVSSLYDKIERMHRDMRRGANRMVINATQRETPGDPVSEDVVGDVTGWPSGAARNTKRQDQPT